MAKAVVEATTPYNDAWSENFGFVPMDRDDFRFAAQSLKKVLVRDLALIAEIDGRPAAFSIALPDLNIALPALKGRLFPWRLPAFFRATKRIDRIRVLTLGVRRDARNRGLDAILFLDVPDEVGFERALKRATEEGRADDTPEAIRRRLEVYHEQTAPLVDFYDDRGLLQRFDGTRSKDEVRDHIRATLSTLRLEETA